MNKRSPSPSGEASSSLMDEKIKQEEDVLESDLCLPAGWILTLPKVDQFWISDSLFRWSEYNLPELDPAKIDQQWQYPPQPSYGSSHDSNSVPALHHFFGHPLFLWMPLTQLKKNLFCPQCKNTKLTHAGLHQELKQVFGYDDFYYLATELLSCVSCKQTFIAWSDSVVSQLDFAYRLQFPCLLTETLGCDNKVVCLIRQRGFEILERTEKLLREQYEEGWIRKQLQFTTAIKSSAGAVSFDDRDMPTTMPSFPKHAWFMQVYIQDALSRMEEIKASITSLFGQVLAIDTSKVRNLSGLELLKTASITNVWNEHGQIIMSVLTESDRCDLTQMADGLVQRYKNAGEEPPRAIYVSSECCGDSNIRKIFREWPEVIIRLDAGHFKRGFSVGCTSEFHESYMGFMAELSQCIFEWDDTDMTCLREAKREELKEDDITPTEAELTWYVKKAEIKLHCKKKVRDTETIERMIERVIEVYKGQRGCSELGAPLFDSEKMKKVWEEQRKHIPCLQTPPGLSLYIKMRTVQKGGRMLPVYQCARGPAFMNKFNQHMDRFHPDTLASPSEYQALFLDGLSRWNKGRTKDTTALRLSPGRCTPSMSSPSAFWEKNS
ncbi:hypothetical protein WMY93_008616 [Mugilogobius chulae]|uniref:DUF6729 domain-containing protein n=1 Tax=Mugilogobius chulae TaxID=88201 RepID=A0AAW0PGG5_9GOBI